MVKLVSISTGMYGTDENGTIQFLSMRNRGLGLFFFGDDQLDSGPTDARHVDLPALRDLASHWLHCIRQPAVRMLVE